VKHQNALNSGPSITYLHGSDVEIKRATLLDIYSNSGNTFHEEGLITTLLAFVHFLNNHGSFSKSVYSYDVFFLV